ncbi:MAG TPA: aminotransferase class V-fold PLP-dependent enzyme [Gammaproteobacteria bacterium]|nr:aminotransferase class V-fold PLP-dependent enzyme [Gammaproteobacteria bacterium]
MNRRDFASHTLGSLAVAPALALVRRLDAMEAAGSGAQPDAVAADETFWAQVRDAYDLHADVVNFDHGWTNPTSRRALEVLIREARQLEALPAEELGRLFFGSPGSAVRPALASVMGVSPAEIALVRNATEALNTILLGLPLKAGDEIVCSAHDYFAMLDALEQRAARDGVVLRMIRPPVPAPSLDALAASYESAIGPRTRLVLLTHPSNRTGQLLPVRRIAAAAHRAGAEVVVDGAQSLGVHEDPIPALDCDYYGASAHKWLGTPVGLGVLWMRPAHVSKIWPLVPPPTGEAGMRRFEWVGTAPAYLEPAALPALELDRSLGAARKAARLRYLSGRIRERIRALVPGARFYTTDDPSMSTGITTLDVPGVDTDVLQKKLRDRHRVLTQSMAGSTRAPEIGGLRITPNVYTTLSEIDRLVAALKASLA